MRVRALVLLAVLLLPLPMLADTYTYTYTGDDFNTDVSGAYTTSDFVSVILTVSAPLADSTAYENAGIGNLDLLSWSFSDGIQSDNSTDPGASASFAIGTNASGQIAYWEINDQFGEPYERIIETRYTEDGSISEDRGIDTESGGGIAYNEGSPSTPPDFDPPGTWSGPGPESSQPSTTPESPSFVFVLLGGASLFGASRFRSRRKLGFSV